MTALISWRTPRWRRHILAWPQLMPSDTSTHTPYMICDGNYESHGLSLQKGGPDYLGVASAEHEQC